MSSNLYLKTYIHLKKNFVKKLVKKGNFNGQRTGGSNLQLSIRLPHPTAIEVHT